MSADAEKLWSEVDRYYDDLLVGEDDALAEALRASRQAGLPPIQVSPAQGKLLMMLAQVTGARRILEIGTLGGYSTIWLARSLGPEGRIVTLEVNPRHADVARENLARAGVADRVEIIVGNALETLPRLSSSPNAPFDFIFIDADKPSTADYFARALKLSRSGTIIIVDNVVRKGAVIDAQSRDADVQGIRRFNAMLAAEKRVTATAIQTVGSKGYDGFVMAVVR